MWNFESSIDRDDEKDPPRDPVTRYGLPVVFNMTPLHTR
jgi:hypothetical protein